MIAVTSQARMVGAHSPSGEKPCAMRNSTEWTAPRASEYSHRGPSNAVPEAVSMPAQMPFPSVHTGASPTLAWAHDRGSVFDHPSWQGSAALATPGAATNIAAPMSPVTVAEANLCEIDMLQSSCGAPCSLHLNPGIAGLCELPVRSGGVGASAPPRAAGCARRFTRAKRSPGTKWRGPGRTGRPSRRPGAGSVVEGSRGGQVWLSSATRSSRIGLLRLLGACVRLHLGVAGHGEAVEAVGDDAHAGRDEEGHAVGLGADGFEGTVES